MTPREAVEAAELAEAETTYRHQLARQMYQAGQRAGLQPDTGRPTPTRKRPGPRSPAPPRTASATPTSRNAAGDPAAAPASQSRAPATSPAGAPHPTRNPKPHEKWRPYDLPSRDPRGNRTGRRL